jgi:hypothetical protein
LERLDFPAKISSRAGAGAASTQPHVSGKLIQSPRNILMIGRARLPLG